MGEMGRQAELVEGFILRRTSTELVIQLRAGNTITVEDDGRYEKIGIGENFFIGWDYERRCVGTVITETDMLERQFKNMPEELIGVALDEIISFEEPLNWDFGTMTVLTDGSPQPDVIGIGDFLGPGQ